MKHSCGVIVLFGCAWMLAGGATQTLAAAAPVHVSAVTAAPLSAAEGSMGRAEPMGSPLHLLVGRSIFINTEARLRRVYVSNPTVLDSFTASPTQIVITAKAAGISSLILWNEIGESQAYLVWADVDVDGLRKSLKEALPYESIEAVGHEDQVSLAGTVSSDAAAATALRLAGLYSKDVANSLLVAPQRTKQVRLKVRIVEIDRSKADQAGFNFFSLGKNTSNFTTGQFPAITTNSTANSSSSGSSSGSSTTSSLLALSDPLNLLFYNSGLNVGAVVRDLENKQILQILAEPTITTVSGQRASFLSGGEFPFPVVQGGTGAYTSVTIQFRPYGVKLDFTPVVTPEDTIQLKVTPEVSALDYSNAVTISGYTIPALSTRRADTQVELKDGQSFAISGLLDHRTTDLLAKTPGIGDIPVLGNLFKSKSINHSVVELVVIVTPSIVDPLTDSTPPKEPKLAIPTLDSQKFDKSVSKKTMPQQ